MTSTAFVACVERGVLEWQALLLFESLRRHGGPFAGCAVFALSPRAGHGVTPETRARLEALEVTYLDEVLNTECVEYGSANRVLAAAHVEAHHPHDVLVVLDSDTLFLRPPEAFALPPDVDVAVRPVDLKGMCSSGPADPNDAYWQALAACCGVALDVLPETRTFVDGARIRASYNGGLVVARGDRGLMQRWADVFLRSARAGLRPHDGGDRFRTGTGWVTPAASRWWGSNQAALALALWSTTRAVVELPPTYNYPLHLHDRLAAPEVFAALVHVHYHWLLERSALFTNPLFGAATPLSADQGAWLAERVARAP